MATRGIVVIISILMSMYGLDAFAYDTYDISVQNEDGVYIFYNYINDGTELEVIGGLFAGKGVVSIPEEITYMNRKRKVTSVGEKAFAELSGVSSVIIPNSVNCIGEKAFFKCYDLTSITIPNSVTSIGKEAFRECNLLDAVTIPNRITNIEDRVFYGCRLSSITIPSSVTRIGEKAFYNCGFESLTIPNSVTEIGKEAFCECFGLTSVSIPNNVTCIEDGTFWNCINMTSLTIPSSVTKIGERAFYNCLSLTSITIPQYVASIGAQAFDGWDFFTVISLIENPFAVEGFVSHNTLYNATLYVPIGTLEKYKVTTGWKDFKFIEEGSPSSITYIESEESKESKRYTLDGRVILDSHKGINIIQMNNGTTKKVLVK